MSQGAEVAVVPIPSPTDADDPWNLAFPDLARAVSANALRFRLVPSNHDLPKAPITFEGRVAGKELKTTTKALAKGKYVVTVEWGLQPGQSNEVHGALTIK